ncbi:hypothetical protein E2C01_032848 [Portunus trituberculatus]|uniref:Uncharacterized protein n=1 Tax=Portunus trituberculatus TaxID=210409 RepID=A0A5B7F1G3_PORTR|nr:hypothetical protein [Portunus trituberculatus]
MITKNFNSEHEIVRGRRRRDKPNIVQDDDSDSVEEAGKRTTSGRPKGESLSVKKERKKAVKEAQAEKRKTKIKKHVQFLLWAMWATVQGTINLGVPPPKKMPVFFTNTASFHVKLEKWSLGRPYYYVNLLLSHVYRLCVKRKGKKEGGVGYQLLPVSLAFRWGSEVGLSLGLGGGLKAFDGGFT